MKRWLWAGFLIAIISFMIWSKDPLNDVVNFIIGGSIPGTQVSIGFWSAIGLALFILLLIHRGIKNARLEMLEHTAKQIKAEQAQAEFKESSSPEFDSKRRSVIAARTTGSSVL